MYKISFPLGKDENDEEVWKEKALKCIEYFTERLKISAKDRDNRTVRGYTPNPIEYRSIIFHSRDYDSYENEFDLLKYYTTDPDEETDENFGRRESLRRDHLSTEE